jgi:hypothetical protein
VSVDGCILNDDDHLDVFYDSSNPIFAFSKSANWSLVKCSSCGQSSGILPVLRRDSRIPTV